MRIALGNKVKDRVTGFVGIATSRCEFLTGCTQYGVDPGVDKDGKRQTIEYFDETRLSVLGKGVTIETGPNGGPQVTPATRRELPQR